MGFSAERVNHRIDAGWFQAARESVKQTLGLEISLLLRLASHRLFVLRSVSFLAEGIRLWESASARAAFSLFSWVQARSDFSRPSDPLL